MVRTDQRLVYADHNATSPLLAEVRAAMEPWLGVPANPASSHRLGQAAAVAVEEAREHVAALINKKPAGVIFTSGATEANHLFLRGAFRLPKVRPRLAVSAIEHPCVKAAVRILEEEQHIRVDWLPISAEGRVELEPIVEQTGVLSMMAANHETGVIQPISAALSFPFGFLVHIDATQAAGRIPLELSRADGVVLSSHKLGGPGGVGALVLKTGDPFPPLLSGGSQERGRRAGTVNVAGVVGFGEACRLARIHLEDRASATRTLSQRLRWAIPSLGGRVVGDHRHLLPNTTLATFAGIRGESLVQALDIEGICASAGAACSSGSLKPSPVLEAMGNPDAHRAVRFSFGPGNNQGEVDHLIGVLDQVLRRMQTFDE